MRRAVRPNIGAVDGSAFGDRTGPRKRLDQVSPEPFARPTVEAVVDRGRRAIVGRTVAPPAADLENMDDAGDHPTIINTRNTARLIGQQRLNYTPLKRVVFFVWLLTRYAPLYNAPASSQIALYCILNNF